MGSMEYHAASLHALAETLNGHLTELQQHGEQVGSAAKTLGVAWEGNDGHEQFAAVHSQWDQHHNDGMNVLGQITGAVTEALSRITAADSNVGQAFLA
ncbi:WXG100 family type VII secretion target [Nocardia sp. alder85J]|uniref:WXG100 family type VII secretion target n=1 Tax=Nocardia sp. alder85J TaxID=2862949 RepID=UPI001CD3BF8E|nr:hypothetical protein [Nocardia sp. alder85J]MCX4093028.1 hypothetical protein [Nocardia sp. alder85J]